MTDIESYRARKRRNTAAWRERKKAAPPPAWDVPEPLGGPGLSPGVLASVGVDPSAVTPPQVLSCQQTDKTGISSNSLLATSPGERFPGQFIADRPIRPLDPDSVPQIDFR